MKKFAKILTVAITAASMLCPTALSAGAKETKTVRLGGQAFGVKFFSDGVMVVELEDFYSGGRYVCPARDSGLCEGDIIKSINGQAVNTNEDVQRATFQSAGEPLKMTLERDGKELIKTVIPKKNSAGAYLSGAWVRDSCAGIGTVTYYDDDEGCFAALGHGICDNDTSALMPLGSAEVVSVDIGSVTKSSEGKAGSLNGCFGDKTLGTLTENTDCGVFGTVSDRNAQKGVELELAENGEIKVGKAEMYTTVSGSSVGCYEVEITKIRNTDSDSNENLVIKVTDDELLECCGGIVQGMSGSPIVQDGKLVGAVTHVFLNDPSEGYGITARNMASNYKG